MINLFAVIIIYNIGMYFIKDINSYMLGYLFGSICTLISILNNNRK